MTGFLQSLPLAFTHLLFVRLLLFPLLALCSLSALPLSLISQPAFAGGSDSQDIESRNIASPTTESPDSHNQNRESTTDTVQQTKLKPYRLTYTASYNGMPISATRELARGENGNYLFKSRAKSWLGKIEETAEFSLDEQNRIRNHNYQYKRRIFGTGKTERLTFDHRAGQAHYKTKKKQRTIPLAELFHSRFSYQLQLRRDLANGTREFSYPTLARGRHKTYAFEVVGEETLETPLGPVKTTKVRRVRKNGERETLLWLANDWEYLLVKLWQREEDGEDYQITLKEGNLAGKSLGSQEAAN